MERKRSSKYYYMKVTRDRFELPVAVADSRQELANICGVSVAAIDRCMHLARRNHTNSMYKKIIKEEYQVL